MGHAFTPNARLAWRAGIFQCLVAMGLTACGGGGAGVSDAAVHSSQASLDTAISLQVSALIKPAPAATATYEVVILEADPVIAPSARINATGQVAFTSLRPDGPHALLYNGQALQDLGMGSTAAINDAAQVAGATATATTTTSPAHALRWSTAGRAPPATIDLGAPAGGSSSAQAINAAGQVAGTTVQNTPVAMGQFAFHPFVWTEGIGMFDLSTLALPGFFPVSASHVNALGQVAGSALSTSANPSLGEHTFVWTPASGIRELGTLGGGTSRAAALNDAAQVAGSSNTEFGPSLRFPVALMRHHAFVWSAAAGMQDLGTLGGRSSDALALNALGQVAGTSDTANGTDLSVDPLAHAFFWSPTGPKAGQMVDLGTLGGGQTSAAVGVNDSGQVVGTSGTSPTSILPHAFIWTAAEGLVDLNTRIARAPAGLTVTQATAISQGGAILAYADSKLVLLKPSGERSANAALSFASPPGAYRAYPGLTGRAKFSSRIRSEGVGQQPTGQTRFHVARAGLRFESTGYDWLNVQASRAQYQGSGTLNGASGYQFRVTLIDGARDNVKDDGEVEDEENDSANGNDNGNRNGNANRANHGDRAPDRLRIRIWHVDAAQGANMVDYDNQLDASTEGTANNSGHVAVHVRRQDGKAKERHAKH
jgi:probable HAF family extracellular repeat protein